MTFTGSSPTASAASVWQTIEDKVPFPSETLKAIEIQITNYT